MPKTAWPDYAEILPDQAGLNMPKTHWPDYADE